MMQEKLLNFLIENKNNAFSINEIAKRIKSDYKLVHTNIKKLEEEKLVNIQRMGNTNLCSFVNNFNYLVLKVEEQRRQKLLKNSNLRVLYERFNQIKNPFFSMLVFGSYAKEKQKKNSDIDLVLIANDKLLIKKIHQLISITPLNIHFIDFTAEEFQKMFKTTDENVGKEIFKNNVILKGVENFYEMIK